MADKQITELTEASALTGEELLVISQDGEAKKVPAKKVAALGGGSGGGSGTDGGYYTPSVTQPTADTMKVTYTPSDASMPEVPAVSVTLPEGPQGKTGPAGYTPVKGTDYWTEADKQEMVDDVLAALPVYNGEVEDV